MPRRHTKKKDDSKFYTKRGEPRDRVLARRRAQAEGKERLKGRVLEKPWVNRHGVEVDLDPVPPPFLRKDMRETRYGDGSRNVRPAEGGRRPYTKRAPGNQRKRNRRRNRAAKLSRRAN
jgi:hypothetical protein